MGAHLAEYLQGKGLSIEVRRWWVSTVDCQPEPTGDDQGRARDSEQGRILQRVLKAELARFQVFADSFSCDPPSIKFLSYGSSRE